jgi:glutaredoxin
MPGRSALMVQLTLYSRTGCHLCDEMKAVVGRLAETIPIELQQVDISDDPELERQYGLEIPVLLVGGVKAAKYRISEEELRRIVQGRSF